MPSRRDPRNKKIWFYRKQVKHPITGEKVKLYETGFKSEKDADAAERKAIEGLGAPEKGLIPTFAEWFNGRFWNEWVIGGPRANSPAEQENKQSIYRVHLQKFFGPLPLDRIDEQLINAFRAHLRGLTKPDGSRALSEKRINNILGVLSTPLKYAERVRVILRAPNVGVISSERKAIPFLEFEEVGALVTEAQVDREPEYEIAILLTFEAGLRIGEVKALIWPYVDMRAKTITIAWQVRPVRDPATKKYVETFGPPKGRRRRVVPMSPALYAALKDRLRTGFVLSGPDPAPPELIATLRDRPGTHFRSTDHAHKHTSETRSALTRIAKRAGMTDRVDGDWHIGRHTFATHAAMLAANPWELQRWMGHQRLEETQLYADVARAHGRKIPPEMLAAGVAEPDPSLRVLCQLSARLDLKRDRNFVAAKLQQKRPAPKKP